MAKQLLGKEVTAAMNEKLQARVAALKEKGVSPKLAIVRCGENPSDLSYEKGATSRAELIGVEVVKFVLPEDVTKEALLAQIDAINADDSIHGCLMSPYSFPRTIQMLPRLQLKPLIQSVHTLEEYNEAYADAISGKFIKVVFGLTH